MECSAAFAVAEDVEDGGEKEARHVISLEMKCVNITFLEECCVLEGRVQRYASLESLFLYHYRSIREYFSPRMVLFRYKRSTICERRD